MGLQHYLTLRGNSAMSYIWEGGRTTKPCNVLAEEPLCFAYPLPVMIGLPIKLYDYAKKVQEDPERPHFPAMLVRGWSDDDWLDEVWESEPCPGRIQKPEDMQALATRPRKRP